MENIFYYTTIVLTAISVYFAVENYRLRQICRTLDENLSKARLQNTRMEIIVGEMRLRVHELRTGQKD